MALARRENYSCLFYPQQTLFALILSPSYPSSLYGDKKAKRVCWALWAILYGLTYPSWALWAARQVRPFFFAIKKWSEKDDRARKGRIKPIKDKERE